MALKKRVIDDLGRDIELYIRVNSAEISNHGHPSYFLFRGYTSKEDFTNGGRYLWESTHSSLVDVSKNIWEQAYNLIKVDGDIDC